VEKAFRLLAPFGLASLVTVILGGTVMALHGSGAGGAARNGLAWAAGLAAALLFVRFGKLRLASPLILAAAAAGLAASFAFPDQQGVHRWLDIGPLHVNAAALLLAPAVVALARIGIWSLPGLAFVAAALVVLVAQPDASQATAFFAAAAILFARSPATLFAKIGAITLAAGLALASWIRPDPLEPVVEVEGILTLAAQMSPVLAAFAALALGAACLSPLTFMRVQPARDAALALAAYFSVSALMPLVGAYPVPLAGMGMSFPLGFWLGFGSLAVLSREAKGDPSPIPFGRRAR